MTVLTSLITTNDDFFDDSLPPGPSWLAHSSPWSAMSMVMHHSVALRRGNTRRNSDDFLLSLGWLAAFLESVLMLVRVMMLHLSTVMDADVGIDCSL